MTNFLVADDGGARIISFTRKEIGDWSTDLTDPDIYEGRALYGFEYHGETLWEEGSKIPESFIRGDT